MTRVNSETAVKKVKTVKKSGGESDVYTALLGLALASLIGATVVVILQAQEMYGEIFKISS